MNENHDLLERMALRSLDLRYSTQPELKNVKIDNLNQQNEYKIIINQKIRLNDNNSLDKTSQARWNRQINHPLINQKKIKDCKIAVFGCGGIGCNVLLGLSYAGVEQFQLIDNDIIERSNLNRQTLYDMRDLYKKKVKMAGKRLLEINPEIEIQLHDMRIDYTEALNLLNDKSPRIPKSMQKISAIIDDSDYIVNAVDLNGAPYLINDLCVINKKPYYWGGVNHYSGEVFSYIPNSNSGCLRCVFGPEFLLSKKKFLRYRTKKEFCFPSANVASTVIITGNLMAEMIIKDINGIKNDCKGKYVIYNGYNMTFNKIHINRIKICECQNF